LGLLPGDSDHFGGSQRVRGDPPSRSKHNRGVGGEFLLSPTLVMV
jgi:hypothetical protein